MTATARQPGAPSRTDLRRRRLLLAAIAFLLLWTFPHLGGLNNPNERVRLYMTAAMVEHGTFAIGYRTPKARGAGFEDTGSVYDRFGYVNDKALVCDEPDGAPPDCAGTLYAAKAPGTSFLGVPAYALTYLGHRLVDRLPTKATALLVLRLFTVILPTLLLLWGIARHLDRVVASPYVRGATLVGLGLGSMLFTYAPVFAGHALAAAALGGAWLLLAGRDDASAPAAGRPLVATALAGLLAGWAVVTEYPSAIGALIVFGWVLREDLPRGAEGRRRLAAFVLGTLPAAALLAWFHWSAFGAPWRTAYTTLENPQFVKDIQPGVMGVYLPDLAAFWGSFLAPFNGLFFFAPWLVLIVPALWSAARWRTGGAGRGTALFLAGVATLGLSFATGWAIVVGVPLVVAGISLLRGGERGPRGLGLSLTLFLAYGLFITSHSLWRGGWTVGPRYVTMMVPFAGLAVAYAADRWMARRPRLTATLLGGLVLASLVVVVATGQVSQGYPPEGPYFTFESRDGGPSIAASLAAIETMLTGPGFVNPLFEFAWPMLRDGWVFPNVGNLLGLRGLVTIVPVGLVLLAVAGWLVAGRRLASLRGRALPVAPLPLATIAVALATLAVLGLSSWRPPTAEKTHGLVWQRSIWDVRDQGEEARERARLEALREERPLTAAEEAALVRALTRQEEDRRALRLFGE